MNKLKFIIAILVTSIFIFTAVSIAQIEAPDIQTTFRIGGHYTTLDDYYKKAGEFYYGKEDPFPEFGLSLYSMEDSKSFNFSGDYFDKKNMFGRLNVMASDILKGSFSYRSFYRNKGTDLLENLMAKEKPDTLVGKSVTHEDTAPGADYGYTRHEINSDLEFKIPIDNKHDLKLIAAHRSIMHKGTEQKIVTMHCSSCHIQSHKVDVDRKSHNLSLDAQTAFDRLELGYGIEYNYYDSDVKTLEVFYDTAQHPNTGGAIGEFDARMNYNGEKVEVAREPKTEKISHRLNLKIPTGKGKLAGAFITSSIKNKWNDLRIRSNGGLLKYDVNFSPELHLLVDAKINRITNDEIFIDVAPWREGLTGGGQNLDYTRYSNLTRTLLSSNAKLKYRLGPFSDLFFQTGYERIKRDDYPEYGLNDKTTKFYGELKFKYRFVRLSSLRAKYRFTSIDNPFTIFGKLLEYRGNGTLFPLPDNGKVNYFQRDEIRYGNATNLPSLKHDIDVSMNVKAIKKLTITGGVRYTLEKNNDLDTFDYERTTLSPSLSFNLLGGPRWSFFAGGSLFKQTANAPVAFAMFDG